MKMNPSINEAQNSDKFTFSYFCAQVCELRQLWGLTTFWTKPYDMRELAIKALGFVFVNLQPKDEEENLRAADLYENTVTEYRNREFRLVLSGRII